MVRISIHTSPKGGDVCPRPEILSSLISIHTSPKGGDAISKWYDNHHFYFNPHLPEGR